jgi:hypothetical protein
LSNNRLVLFLDDQNFYNGARRSFFSDQDSHFYGSVKPIELGKLICSRPPPGIKRQLHQVRIYTGRPDSNKEPKTYSAHLKQCAYWQGIGAKVIARPLRYPKDWPNSKAQQKGVDVALALDFVIMAIDDEYEVGVIASTDSDLRPALEYVHQKCKKCHIEVASWFSSRHKSRLNISGGGLYYHKLDKTDYDSVADLTDYNI